MSKPKPGDIRVWYIPQVGHGIKPFEVICPDFATAKLIDQTLAKFSLYEYENRIKGDYADAGGVSRWEDHGDGYRWYDVPDSEMCDDPVSGHGEWIANHPLYRDRT